MTHERRYIRNVPKKLWQELCVLAAQRGATISSLIVAAIERYLAREGK